MWSLVGQALSTRNAHQEAETALRRSLALHPDADTHDYLARVLADTGRLDEALAEERRAAALQPGSAEIISNLGLLLGRKGRHAEAADQFRAALWLEPGNLFIRRNLEIAQRAALRSLSVPDSPTPP